VHALNLVAGLIALAAGLYSIWVVLTTVDVLGWSRVWINGVLGVVCIGLSVWNLSIVL
jgi:hypothetical protein